jgi:hypothetical protein
MLFVFFKTVCHYSALAAALVGHIERTDIKYYLRVREKGGKMRLIFVPIGPCGAARPRPYRFPASLR